MTDARHYTARETLKNGLAVTIRSVRADDRARLQKAFAGLERETVYTRFFSFRNALSDAELDRLAAMDFVRDAMLVAALTEGVDEAIIASGRYVAGDDATAEVAFTVEEDYQGLGLAGRLLAHLAIIARNAGIRRFVADVLPENKAMLAVFAKSGWPMQTRHDPDALHVTMSLDGAA